MKWDERQLWPSLSRVVIKCNGEELRPAPWPSLICYRAGVQHKQPWPPPLFLLNEVVSSSWPPTQVSAVDHQLRVGWTRFRLGELTFVTAKTKVLHLLAPTVVLCFCGVLPLIKKPWSCLQNGSSFGGNGGQYADGNDHLKAPGKIKCVTFNSFEGTPDGLDTVLDQCLLMVQNSSIQHEWISLVLISGADTPLDDSNGMILMPQVLEECPI